MTGFGLRFSSERALHRQRDELARKCPADVFVRNNIMRLSSGLKREEWHSRCCMILH